MDLLTCVTVLDQDAATAALEAGGHGAAATVADLARLVRQASLTHADRTRLLVVLDEGLPGVSEEAMSAAADAVRSAPPRLPAAAAVTLGPLDPALTSAMGTLFHLDATVAAPWTLIGGLMTLLHCTEHRVPFSRPTGDADIAVGVFTHRGALWTLTQTLRDLGFEDRTTSPLTGGGQLSYRWSDGDVQVDVAVPPKVNAQRDPPLTASGRPAVELPATQQALRRTGRAPVTLADGTVGAVRRPDLLAAMVIKAQAALSDRRDTDRTRRTWCRLWRRCRCPGSTSHTAISCAPRTPAAWPARLKPCRRRRGGGLATPSQRGRRWSSSWTSGQVDVAWAAPAADGAGQACPDGLIGPKNRGGRVRMTSWRRPSGALEVAAVSTFPVAMSHEEGEGSAPAPHPAIAVEAGVPSRVVRHRRHRFPARDKVVKVRYDDREHALLAARCSLLAAAADRAGLTVAGLLAGAGLSVAGQGPPPSQAADRELLAELLRLRLAIRRYAMNVNQAVAALHSTGEALCGSRGRWRAPTRPC